jgi:hypothetical protein
MPDFSAAKRYENNEREQAAPGKRAKAKGERAERSDLSADQSRCTGLLFLASGKLSDKLHFFQVLLGRRFRMKVAVLVYSESD